MKKYIFVLILLLSLFLISNVSIKKETSIDTDITVEIKGEVDNPGVFTLKRGSTLNDLLKLIKLKKDADISRYSLNDVLFNKQLIVISKADTNKNLISINSATLSQLCLLPGIGESLAQRIIDYRTKNGSFNTLDELKNISGIGDKKYEKLLEFITL